MTYSEQDRTLLLCTLPAPSLPLPGPEDVSVLLVDSAGPAEGNGDPTGSRMSIPATRTDGRLRVRTAPHLNLTTPPGSPFFSW